MDERGGYGGDPPDPGPKLGNTYLLPHPPNPYPRPPLCMRAAEDLTTAHAILDLSSPHRISLSKPNEAPQEAPRVRVPFEQNNNSPARDKTIAYTYDEFFVSDGRSKRRLAPEAPHSQPNGKYQCSECGKNYATSSNLSRHKQTHKSLDSGDARQCPTCGKAYVSMPALAMHVLTHKLAHKCAVCGKAFSRPWLLQGHLRSHTGERPYGCAHCGKAFADRSNLRAHMQTHSGSKSFRCRRCHKAFALKTYLSKHLESACLKDPSSPSPSDPPSPLPYTSEYFSTLKKSFTNLSTLKPVEVI